MMSEKENQKKLKSKIAYFFKQSKKRDAFFLDFLLKAQDVGSLALFGGKLRDMVLKDFGFNKQNINYGSDIDLVILSEKKDFFNLTKKYDHKINKFGGCRIKFKKTVVDFWTLESTWAFKSGHVTGNNFCDLTKTTFFDWDAIICHIDINRKKRKIFAIEKYWDKINSGVIDINLTANPNEMGTLIRILKILVNGIKISKKMAIYLYERINYINGNQLNFNNGPFFEKAVTIEDLNKIKKQLIEYIEYRNNDYFYYLNTKQLQLFDYFKNNFNLIYNDSINCDIYNTCSNYINNIENICELKKYDHNHSSFRYCMNNWAESINISEKLRYKLNNMEDWTDVISSIISINPTFETNLSTCFKNNRILNDGIDQNEGR